MTRIIWTPDDFETIGLLGDFLDDENPASAREQLDANYQHGGGFRPFEGFVLRPDDSIKYPGDPAQYPVARAQLRDEQIILYRNAWVAIIQPDRSYVIARMD